MGKAPEIWRIWEVWSGLALSEQLGHIRGMSCHHLKSLEKPWYPRVATFPYFCEPDYHQWSSTQKTNTQNNSNKNKQTKTKRKKTPNIQPKKTNPKPKNTKKTTETKPLPLQHDLFISQNACQLKSYQPDPNPSYFPNLWSSLQQPFPPWAMISSSLISKTRPGLTGTMGDTSEGIPDASESS